MASHLNSILTNSDELEHAITAHGKNSTYNVIDYYFDKILPAVEADVLEESPQANARRGAIWIALVFRMICWSLLHDFDKADVNLIPSDLKGSRMPLFIG